MVDDGTDPRLLVAVVDANPCAYAFGENGGRAGGGRPSLRAVGEQLCLFLHAFRALHASNRAAVVLASPAGFRVALRAGDDQAGQLHALLVPELLGFAAACERASRHTALSAALSAALCHAERAAQGARLRPQVQLLIVCASPDHPRQYNSVMNCIFAAQAAGVAVDAVALHGESSPFLQQAAHLTGGVYMQPGAAAVGALAQLLIAHALPGREVRKKLVPPAPHDVDFRAACFVTHEMLDRAYVCSVCLSIFHHPNIIECPACGTRYKPVGAGPRRKKKRSLAAAGGSERGA